MLGLAHRRRLNAERSAERKRSGRIEPDHVAYLRQNTPKSNPSSESSHSDTS